MSEIENIFDRTKDIVPMDLLLEKLPITCSLISMVNAINTALIQSCTASNRVTKPATLTEFIDIFWPLGQTNERLRENYTLYCCPYVYLQLMEYIQNGAVTLPVSLTQTNDARLLMKAMLVESRCVSTIPSQRASVAHMLFDMSMVCYSTIPIEKLTISL